MTAFLQLLSMERVSCELTLRSGPRVGRMAVLGGDLVSADFEELDGVAAAHALVGLPDVNIEMVEREHVRQSDFRVPLTAVVLEALRQRDEHEHGQGAFPSILPGPAPASIPPPFQTTTPPPSPPLYVSPPPPAARQLESFRPPRPITSPPPPVARPIDPPRAVTPPPPAPEPLRAVPPPAPAPEPPGATPVQPTIASPASEPPPPSSPEPTPRAVKQTPKEQKMNVINIDKANNAVNKLRETLGTGLIATDVWSVDDGMSIAGFNSQPVATALFNRITDLITETLSESGFPLLNKYYLLDLDGDKLAVILPLGSYRAGMLVDKKKAQLGVIVSVALPKYITSLEEAMRG
jgi:hypothetical protein